MKPERGALLYVCDAAELSNNQIRRFDPPDRPPVALYRVANEFYATDDTCTHGAASLSEGDVDDACVVECPWHNGTFDIRTGAALSFPCVLPLKVHAVTVMDGKVHVALDSSEGER
jgi:nitrite reductase/ring-hydroxylating ferredoxin subunit